MAKSGVGTYRYGERGIGPHAVTSVVGAANAEYGYDSNGNQVSGRGRSLAYTSFNKPALIQRGVAQNELQYGAGLELIVRIQAAGNATRTTHYVGGVFERIEGDGQILEKCYISAGGTVVAIDHRASTPDGTRRSQSLAYLYQDHLGSTDVVTDASGSLLEDLSYDPHGQRRAPDGRSQDLGRGEGQITERGFGNHLQLDALEVVHMGGRVYDPLLGRFLSPDPFVQTLNSTQALNRYAYVLNSPLSLVDPSGFFFDEVGDFLEDWWRPLAAIGAAVFVGPAAGGLLSSLGVGTTTAAVAGHAIGGAAAGAINGGNLEAAAIGAVAGAAFGGVSVSQLGNNPLTGALAHGLAGGISSEMRGGKFAHGFFSQAYVGLTGGPISSDPAKGIGAIVSSSFHRGINSGIAASLVGSDVKRAVISGALNGAVSSVARGGDADHLTLADLRDGFEEVGLWLYHDLKSAVVGSTAGKYLSLQRAFDDYTGMERVRAIGLGILIPNFFPFAGANYGLSDSYDDSVGYGSFAEDKLYFSSRKHDLEYSRTGGRGADDLRWVAEAWFGQGAELGPYGQAFRVAGSVAFPVLSLRDWISP